ncbi:MAG: magnesium/cobalt transporter CorA [Bacteroidota bacterium]|jgi:magnesium transporter
MAKRNTNTSHTTKRIKNSRLIETLTYSGDVQIGTSIELVQYNENQFLTKSLSKEDNLNNHINKSCTNWFKIVGISDVETIYSICKSLGVQRFDVKDLLSQHHITKVIAYEKSTFVLTANCTISTLGDTMLSQVGFILGENYVVSIQETKEPIFDDVKEAIAANRVHLREKKSDYLLYILLSDVHSSYNDTIMKLVDKIDSMEDHLIENDTKGVNVMRFIQARKKNYSLLKRAISGLREEYVNIQHNTNALIVDENKMYFNDFDDKLRTSLDDLESLYLLISSLSDLYFNNNNLQMNGVIKKLTIVSTIFIPLTFMVGVWGMNFDFMPELHWTHGYLFAWGVMALIVSIAVFYLKHKKWF